MNIARIQFPVFNPYNKPSVEIYCSGCVGRCDGCHNRQLWDFKVGRPFSYSDLWYMRERQDLFEVIGLLGGEPLDQNNIEFKAIINLLKCTFPSKEFWLFTRYEMDEVPDWCKIAFDYIKVGKYMQELYQDGFPASSNQKLLKKVVHYGNV